MGWEVILGTDPRFEYEMSRALSQIFDPVFYTLFHKYLEQPDHYIQFHNKDKRLTRTLTHGRPIKSLSSVDSEDPNEVINLLGRKSHSLPNPLLDERLAGEGEVVIAHRATFVSDEDDSSLSELLFSFALTLNVGGKMRWMWEADYAIYFDKSLAECYAWARLFEDTVSAIIPNVQFQNRIGICNDCANMLCAAEHGRREIAWDIYLCEDCYIQREIKKSREDLKKKEDARQRREARKNRLPVFTSTQIIHPNEKLGQALYNIYDGKCQYCDYPERLSKDRVVIEHIVPQAIPLDSVYTKHRQNGISEAAAQHFCETFLPPNHDCVLNYILSCIRHNNKKSGELLHIASLEMTLQRAKRKAQMLLDEYAAILSL